MTTWIISIGIALSVLLIVALAVGASTARDPNGGWQSFLTKVTSLGAVVGGLIGLVQYMDQRDRALDQQIMEQAQKNREFNLTAYTNASDPSEGRRVLLNELADLVATLATCDRLSDPQAMIAHDRFERIYHGQLVLYESRDVSDAMIDFRDALLKWKKTGVRPEQLLGEERTNSKDPLPFNKKENSDFLRQLALTVSFCCREELQEYAKSK